MLEGLLIGAALSGAGFWTLRAGRIVGGGDAKLFAAITPWMGAGALGSFSLLYTAIAGLVLAIVMGVSETLPILPIYAHAPWFIELHNATNDLPYGVAIGAGGLLSFSQTPFFQLVFGG